MEVGRIIFVKILHVSHLYYPSVGGNQYHNQLMSEKLAEMGEEVHVFTSLATDMQHFSSFDPSLQNLPEQETKNGVHVRRFKGCLYITTGQRDKGPDNPAPDTKFEQCVWKAKFSLLLHNDHPGM